MSEKVAEPRDDGACSHLAKSVLPDVNLPSTLDDYVNLSKLGGRIVVYCYPMTARPGTPLPAGWDDIPGARGCTPQSCSFRDHHAELEALGARVFGLSTQDTEYQKEMVERLHLPFRVLSDKDLIFSDALQLPRFKVEADVLLKRVTLVANEGVIEAVHYPVFPSDSDPAWVIDYLETNKS